MIYTLIVGNVGQTYSGTNGFQARVEYGQAVAASKAAYGRQSAEPVTLFAGDEILFEYCPKEKP